MSKLSRSIKSVLRALGYDLRRVGDAPRDDPHADLAAILRGRDVRTMLDVGANVGHTVKAFLRLFPDAAIHAFEPFEATAATLAEAVGSSPRVQIHRLAVSDAVGAARFHANSDHATSSLLPVAGEAAQHVDPGLNREVAAVEVPTTTLDAFCAERGIRRVDVLKLDIQGGERLALAGARGLLASGAVDVVCTEVLFAPLYEGQAGFEELRALLAGHGYALFGLYGLTRGRSGVLAWGDAIFVAPRIREALAAG